MNIRTKTLLDAIQKQIDIKKGEIDILETEFDRIYREDGK